MSVAAAHVAGSVPHLGAAWCRECLPPFGLLGGFSSRLRAPFGRERENAQSNTRAWAAYSLCGRRSGTPAPRHQLLRARSRWLAAPRLGIAWGTAAQAEQKRASLTHCARCRSSASHNYALPRPPQPHPRQCGGARPGDDVTGAFPRRVGASGASCAALARPGFAATRSRCTADSAVGHPPGGPNHPGGGARGRALAPTGVPTGSLPAQRSRGATQC